jgi:hypothetical protein
MLQVFYVNVAKVDQDVAYVASVSEACCKRLFKIFHLFSDVCLGAFFYLDVAYVSLMLQEYVPMVSLFQSYVAVSVFMWQVASVLSGCCICFMHMFQVYVPNILFASDVCCIQVFHVSEVC